MGLLFDSNVPKVSEEQKRQVETKEELPRELTGMENLPHDIVRVIIEFMSPPSIAAFMRTNSSYYHLMDDSMWKRLYLLSFSEEQTATERILSWKERFRIANEWIYLRWDPQTKTDKGVEIVSDGRKCQMTTGTDGPQIILSDTRITKTTKVRLLLGGNSSWEIGFLTEQNPLTGKKKLSEMTEYCVSTAISSVANHRIPFQLGEVFVTVDFRTKLITTRGPSTAKHTACFELPMPLDTTWVLVGVTLWNHGSAKFLQSPEIHMRRYADETV